LLVFCFTNHPSVNLLAVITVTILLLTHLPYDNHMMLHPNGASKSIRFWGGSYYRKPYLFLLETSFLLNLAMLAAGSWYVRSAEGSQRAVVDTFVGITFCQFIGIIILHSYNQLKKWWLGRKRKLQLVSRADYEPIPDQPVDLKEDQWSPYRPMNQCREILLEDEDNWDAIKKQLQSSFRFLSHQLICFSCTYTLSRSNELCRSLCLDTSPVTTLFCILFVCLFNKNY